MALVIEDKATGFLKQLGIVAPNYINEALSKGASLMYEAIQVSAASYGKSDFSQYHTKNGQRGIAGRYVMPDDKRRRSRTVTSFGNYFRRTSRTASNQPAQGASNIAKLTRFRLYDEKMKAVVGWMQTKSFNASDYQDGAYKGVKERVKGTSFFDYKRDTQKTQNIANLLEFGGQVSLTQAQKNLFMRAGFVKSAARGYAIRKARPIVAPAYAASRSAAEAKLVEVVSKIVDYKETNNLQKRGAA